MENANVCLLYSGGQTIVAQYYFKSEDKNTVMTLNPLELVRDDDGIAFRHPLWSSVSSDSIFFINYSVFCSPSSELKSKYLEAIENTSKREEEG